MSGEFEALLGGPDAALGRSVLRTGVILASPPAAAGRVTVQIDEDGPVLPPLPFLSSYVPRPGDLVWVLFGTTPGGSLAGIVLGGKAGRAGNLVINPNFYHAAVLVVPTVVNAPPYHWFRYVTSGTASVFAQIEHLDVHRFFGGIVAPGGGAASDTSAYSAAIAVTPGVAYSLTTSGRASVFASSTLTVQSRVAWFAAATDDYPNFIAETQYGTDTVPANTVFDVYHSGSVTAPAGANFARVVMRHSWTGAAAAGVMYWGEAVMLPPA